MAKTKSKKEKSIIVARAKYVLYTMRVIKDKVIDWIIGEEPNWYPSYNEIIRRYWYGEIIAINRARHRSRRLWELEETQVFDRTGRESY